MVPILSPVVYETNENIQKFRIRCIESERQNYLKKSFKVLKCVSAWKVSVFGVCQVCIFPHLDWIRVDMEYLSISSPNAGKYVPEKLRIRTLFTQDMYQIYEFQEKVLNLVAKRCSVLLKKVLIIEFLFV